MKTHKFDVEDAAEHGVHKAIILEHLKFHQQANQGHSNMEADGKTWAFLNSNTIEKMYPYLSYSSVARWLRELEEAGVVESYKPRSKWGNHLKYYRVVEPGSEEDQSNTQNTNSNTQNTNSSNTQNTNSSNITLVNNHGEEKNKQKSGKLSAKERTKKYIPLAKYLSKIVRSHINYKIDRPRIKSWARDLRLLHEQNGVHPKRQKEVLDWYKKNIGGDFIPEAFSGSSFREKFPKLEAAIKRQKSPPATNGQAKPATAYRRKAKPGEYDDDYKL